MNSNNERIMAKIRKCLALSKSDNEHEAAAALRQAKALMEKHKLEMSDIEQSKTQVYIDENGKPSSRPPLWLNSLHSVVAAAFGCSAFSLGGQPLFVGEAPAPEIAAYASKVLEAQLRKNKDQYLADIRKSANEHSKKIKRTHMTALGKGIAEGWVYGCQRVVERFAGELPDEIARQHKERVSSYFSAPVVERHQKSAAESSIGKMALADGYRRGKEAQIHAGMSADEGPARLSHRASL